jgi:hypothetical protein
MNKEERKKELIKFFKHFLKTSVRHYDEKNLTESVVNHYLQTIEETEEKKCPNCKLMIYMDKGECNNPNCKIRQHCDGCQQYFKQVTKTKDGKFCINCLTNKVNKTYTSTTDIKHDKGIFIGLPTAKKIDSDEAKAIIKETLKRQDEILKCKNVSRKDLNDEINI